MLINKEDATRLHDAGVMISAKRNLGIIIGLTTLASIIVILPVVIVSSTDGWQKLSAWSTYTYMLLTGGMLIVIFLTAVSALKQLTEAIQQRRLALIGVVFKLSEYYAGREMSKAVAMVWDSEPTEIRLNEDKKSQRRMVSEFWNSIAWAVKENLIELDFFHRRFGNGALDIWDKRLRSMELEERLAIEKRDNPGRSEEEILSLAKRHVDEELPLGWLAGEWRKKTPS